MNLFDLQFAPTDAGSLVTRVFWALHGNVAQIVTSVEKPLAREADPLVYR